MLPQAERAVRAQRRVMSRWSENVAAFSGRDRLASSDHSRVQVPPIP